MHPTLSRLAHNSLAEPLAAHPSTVQPLNPRLDDAGAFALVVSSDTATRAQLSHAVVALGFDAVTATDTSAARDRLNSGARSPSLVILDNDTYNSMGLVHSLKDRPEVPVVVCGARGSGFVRKVTADADGFVAKPLQLPGVIAELRATMHRTPAQRLAIRRARRSLIAG